MVAARRHLVLVRAGASSLHRTWLGGPARNFDIAVSAFGTLTPEAAGPVDLYAHYDGGKWDGIAHFLRERPTLLEAYDYVWLPDDDIATDAASIERMFAIARHHRLDVCQPALTADSFYSYPETLALDGYVLRYTNLVEIMMPCLAVPVLRELLPLLGGTMSGFGLDMVWARRRPPGDRAYAILDACAMRHTRPVGTALKRAIDAVGRDQWHERDALLASCGADEITPTIHAARRLDGRLVTGRARLGLAMAAAWWRARAEYVQPPRRKHFRRLLERHLAPRAPALQPLPLPSRPSVPRPI